MPSRILLWCALSLLWFLSPVRAADTDFSEQSIGWEKDLGEIGDTLETEGPLAPETIRHYRQNLRRIRVQALEKASELKKDLETQQDILATLGEASEAPEEENVRIRKQREALSSETALLDARLKQTRLLAARADELLLTLDRYEARKLKEKLLARSPFPFSQQALYQAGLEAAEGLRSFDAWFMGALVILTLILIIALSPYLTHRLNRFVAKAPRMGLHAPFSRTRLALVSISAYFVFLLRFHILDFGAYETLENMTDIAANLCLSITLFLSLGKLYFMAPEADREFIGERNKSYSWLWNGLKQITRLILLLVPIISIFGYTNLGQYISFNVLITLVTGLLFFLLRGLAVRLNRKLSHADEKEENLSPLTITILEPLLALLSFSVALFFWGMTTEDVQTLVARYSTGITVGDITFDFAGIFAGILVFLGLYLLTKTMQWFLGSRVFPYTALDAGIRDAITSVTGYSGIIIALLAAMSTLGLDMSNLAIVAGALSVGIGFGLQAIINNFVSGLILLFERPVKVGDWVVVGDQQGTIKKIRVRSTEIETFWNSSVIVPNSQLISETVTNWTLHDKVGRVDIAVGVAYGSDTEQVKKVLLETAKQNPQVRAVPEPKVFFMNFGDSSLDFELRCFIRNIRDVFAVSSELRFAIDKAFREHNIQIPFPQRDLHIVSTVPMEMKQP